MSEFVVVKEGKDTLHVEIGFDRSDEQHVWREKLDKATSRTYYVNLGTAERKWKLPTSAEDGGQEKKSKPKKKSAAKGLTNQS